MPAQARRHSGAPSRPRRRPTNRPRSAKSAQSPKPSVASELERLLDLAMAQPATDRTFAELGLPKSLVMALSKRGIEKPFAIQSHAIPDALAGRDVLGRAQTGGGKTMAFGLPMLARLASSGSMRMSKAPRRTRPRTHPRTRDAGRRRAAPTW